MKSKFKNANEAYEGILDEILQNGIDFGDTKAIFNCGFYIDNPSDKLITNAERKWNQKYADPSINKLGELYGSIPPIWKRMADNYGLVNSNYGYQWQRNNQLSYVVNKLREDTDTRQAAISIYDAKEHHRFTYDTPCTYAVQFSIIDEKLCMSVYMRSNDIWYGFCNDQYQFASLQEMVADMLHIETGWYYHHAHNMHLYKNKL